MATKRFIVYGAGAIGGVLGSLLHRAGHDVVLIARGRHLEAIRAGGLRLVTAEGEQDVRVPALAGPHELEHRPGDVVLLAMKSMDTEEALRALAPGVDPATPIVCVQNGVANERSALRLFSHVYGVCVMFPATHLEPGVVQAGAWPVPALLDIGRYRGEAAQVPPDETAAEIAAAFRSAGCRSEPRADIMRWKYRKLLTNLGNAVNAVAGRAEGASDLTDAIRAEGEQVLEAAGIPVASREEDQARRGDILRLRPIDRARPVGEFLLAEPRTRHRLDRGRLPERRDRTAGPAAWRPGSAERGGAATGRPVRAGAPAARLDARRGAAHAARPRSRAAGRRLTGPQEARVRRRRLGASSTRRTSGIHTRRPDALSTAGTPPPNRA